jgi:hypothetical protein
VEPNLSLTQLNLADTQCHVIGSSANLKNKPKASRGNPSQNLGMTMWICIAAIAT